MELSVIQNPELVVAIDFGSTYSGYAWQFRTDFVRNKGNVEVNSLWGCGALQLHKTTTCLLLKANGDDESKYEIDSFGYEAEKIYINVSKEHETERGDENKIQEKLFLFKRFKHLLYNKDFDGKTTVEDQLNRPFPLFVVLSKFLQALKDHFINSFREKGHNVNLDKILWVITVPTIWSEKAKAFMREAMENALMEDTDEKPKNLSEALKQQGKYFLQRIREIFITKKKKINLLLALEPEAAAIYCTNLPGEQKDNMGDLGAPGQVFLTADLGGLTSDLSAVKVLEDGLLQEVCISQGELVGGQNVNDAFFQACHDSFDGESWKKTFGKSMPIECLEMEDDFEQKKVTIGKKDKRLENITLKVPYRILKEIEQNNIKVDEKQGFLVNANEFMFKSEFVRNKLFKETCTKMYDVMKNALRSEGLKDCRTVVLVGGFAESPIAVKHIREAIEKNFPKIKVVVPTSPFKAVLTGAVLFGHNPLVFISRIARYTYGVGACILFDEKRHDKEKMWLNKEDKNHYCKDVFDVHVEKGQSVILKEQIQVHKYNPTYKNQKNLKFSIYASDRAPMNSTEKGKKGKPKDVMYITDEGCEKIGEIDVEIPDTTLGTERNFLVRMVYGGTELSVIVKDETSGNEYPLRIDFENLYTDLITQMFEPSF